MAPYVSETIERLVRARATAWMTLQPAFDHAIVLAKEAEYQADRASNEVLSHVAVAYPPLVVLLAESVDAVVPAEVPF